MVDQKIIEYYRLCKLSQVQSYHYFNRLNTIKDDPVAKIKERGDIITALLGGKIKDSMFVFRSDEKYHVKENVIGAGDEDEDDGDSNSEFNIMDDLLV